MRGGGTRAVAAQAVAGTRPGGGRGDRRRRVARPRQAARPTPEGLSWTGPAVRPLQLLVTVWVEPLLIQRTLPPGRTDATSGV